LPLNYWALAGDWTLHAQATVLHQPSGQIAYRFDARDLHLVMGPARGTPARFRVLLDGQPPGAAHGTDIDDHGSGTITEPRLTNSSANLAPSASAPSRSPSSTLASRPTPSPSARSGMSGHVIIHAPQVTDELRVWKAAEPGTSPQRPAPALACAAAASAWPGPCWKLAPILCAGCAQPFQPEDDEER
jgi:Thioredoxin like C-terminal domain